MIRKIEEIGEGCYYLIEEYDEDDWPFSAGDFNIIRPATQEEIISYITQRENSNRRSATCYDCGSSLDSAYDDICPKCGWMICSTCGSCNCDR